MDATRYHSPFGGMWIDREDWQQELDARRAHISPTTAKDIENFVRDGFIVFRGAAKRFEVDAFERAITRAFAKGSDEVLCQLPGDQMTQPISQVAERRGLRVVDAYAVMPEALDLLANARVVGFLRAIFDEDPLLFQGLSFDRGSEQGLHQDTAYVVVDRPLELAACWIALEDIAEGSGELMYVPGSHRFPESGIFNGKKHWNPDVDGHEVHKRWFDYLEETAKSMGLKRETFLPKKGDILVWHADLAHGGVPIRDASKSRRSLVGHYCPVSARPHYFSYRPDRQTIRKYGPLSYASLHFDLAAMPERLPKRPSLVDRVLRVLQG